MKNARDIIRQMIHSALCALVVGLLCTSADFAGMPVDGWKDILTVGLQWAAVVVCLWCLMMIVTSTGKWAGSVIMGIVMLASSILAYYRYEWHYSLNPTMFDILGATASGGTMITWQLVAWAIFSTAIGVTVMFIGQNWYKKSWKTALVAAVGVISMWLILREDSRLSMPVRNRIPINTAYVYKEYAENKHEIATARERTIGQVEPVDDDLITIVVIGEAVRSANLGLNGYWRETTPLLSKRQGVVSFRNMWTDIVYTNGSIPRIMTGAGEDDSERAYRERSFIDFYKSAGMPSYVITNQNVEKQYAYFWGEADSLIVVNNCKNVYNYSKWLDSNTLEPFGKLVQRMEEGLIVVHCIGSHWWYDAHYPDSMKYYQPTTKSRIVSNCDSMEMVNSYDNTVRYMDYIVDQMIEWTSDRKAMLIYISDHGEALGENGNWLHASECEAMHRTASFVWMSDKYREERPDLWEDFQNMKDKKMKTDQIYKWIKKEFKKI